VNQRQRNDFDRKMRERSEIKMSPGSRSDRNRSPQQMKIESVQPKMKATEPDKAPRQGGDRKVRKGDLSRKAPQEKNSMDSFQPQTTPGAELQQNPRRTEGNRAGRQRVEPGAATRGQIETNRRQPVRTESPRQQVRQIERSRERSVDLEQQLMNQATEGSAVGRTQSPQSRDKSFDRFDGGQTTQSWSDRGRSNRQRIPQNLDEDEKSNRGRGRR